MKKRALAILLAAALTVCICTIQIAAADVSTVLIENFDSSTEVPSNFVCCYRSNGNGVLSVVADDESEGNNVLKNAGAQWSGPCFSFDSVPENCLGFRFKMKTTAATTYNVWMYNKAVPKDSSGRLADYRNIAATKSQWATYEFYFAKPGGKPNDNSASSVLVDADIPNLKSIIIMPGTKDTSYFDDIEWIVEKSDAAASITMESGAAMRIDGATYGIRFTATVDKTSFDSAVSGGTVTEIGTLIAKEGTALENVVVENAVEVTNNNTELADGKIPVAKYAAGTTMQTAEDANKYIIVGSLVEIKDANANVKYQARAYVKYKVGETEYVLYADALSDARSIAQVANSIKTAGDGYYDSLCKSHKSVVDKWADKFSA